MHQVFFISLLICSYKTCCCSDIRNCSSFSPSGPSPAALDPDSVRNAGALIRGPIRVQRWIACKIRYFNCEINSSREDEVEVEAEVDVVEIASSCDASVEMS